MGCYYIVVLKPLNKTVASHIIDGDNWDAITALCETINCLDSDHDEINFTKKDANDMFDYLEAFLSMCYTKDGKTYMNDGDVYIYGAKSARAMFPFLKQCNGFTVKYISVNEEIVDNFD